MIWVKNELPDANDKFGSVRSEVKMREKKENAVAGDRTRVTRVTGGNTHHYTTTTCLCLVVIEGFFITLSNLKNSHILHH